MAPITNLLRLLQFGDSTLPVGGFSFSNGLEFAVQHGVVHDRQSLRQFVSTAVRQSATVDGVALLVAHRAATADDIAGVLRADHALLQRKLNEEMRTMTVRMGRKLAELTNHVLKTELSRRWVGCIAGADSPGTYPVSLAVVCAALELAEHEAFAVQQYGVASSMLGAALRLMKVSFLDTQSILLEINASAEASYAQVANATLDDMAAFSPMLDILTASHVRAHVRMFMN